MGKISDALEKANRESPSTKKAASPNIFDDKVKIPIHTRVKDSIDNPEKKHVVTRVSSRSKLSKHRKLDKRSKKIGAGFHKDLILLNDPHSLEAEQFKILRTNILFRNEAVPPRVILVTSAAPGEGKSFVASNLAISFAQKIDGYVLLMDCDIRSPCLHAHFGYNGVPGISEYLSNSLPLHSLLLKTNLSKMSFLPAGRVPHNPSELLSSKAMFNLINELKSRYADRYIIIDSPPPLLAAETAAIAKHVDGIIIVVKYGQTPRRMIKDLMHHIDSEKILGVVFNQIDKLTGPYYAYTKAYK